MNVDIVNNLICRFYEEIIKNGDNIFPTRVSIITYGYFQLLYNILTIFSNNIPSNDRVNIYNWHALLKNRYQSINAQVKNITFLNFLYFGHQGYLNAMYSDYKLDSLQMNDLNMTDIKLENNNIKLKIKLKIKILLPSVANTICLQSIYFILVKLVNFF